MPRLLTPRRQRLLALLLAGATLVCSPARPARAGIEGHDPSPSPAAGVRPEHAVPLPAERTPATQQKNLFACPISGISVKSLLTPAMGKPVIPLKKKAWEQSVGGEQAAQPYIQARLAGWPQHLLTDKSSLPRDDRDFALRVARDTWRGLAAFTDRENGLPVDNVRLGKDSVAIAASHIGDYTSGSNIGLYLMAIAGAQHLQLLSAREATDRARKILDTLERLEGYRGFFFNFYDTTSLERTSNFVSLVDSSWLTAGLMVARMAFPELRDRFSKLIAGEDFGFFYNPAKRELSHGYYVNPGARSPYDYGVLYTEARIGSLIAIGKGDVPEQQWFAMVRTFPPDCTWQTLAPRASRVKTVRGHHLLGGYAEWKGVRYVPSWGGSMFEALMPTLVLDEQKYAPRSLGANDEAHAVVQRRYALEQLGYPVWGMSPSAAPTGGEYGEYGVKVLGARGYGAGAVTPHASALALGVTPEAALSNLRALAERYDIYGEYGFYDAVDPLSGAVAHEYLALDQSMLFVALANYLGDRCISESFASDPIMQKVLPMIGEEDFFD